MKLHFGNAISNEQIKEGGWCLKICKNYLIRLPIALEPFKYISFIKITLKKFFMNS